MREQTGRRRRWPALLLGGASVLTACGGDAVADQATTVTTTVAAATTTTGPSATTTTTATTTTSTTTTSTTSSTTSTTTTSTTTTTTTTTTTLPPPPPPVDAPPAADPAFAATLAAFERLAAANTGASISVARGGDIVLEAATGPTVAGSPAEPSTPMVVASVSKIMLAATIARLDRRGVLEIDGPVPWSDMGLAPHPGWEGTTLRQLLDHSAGMPVARAEWFRGGETCRSFVPRLLDRPPTGDRGDWRYSNGNYCLLGLVVEQVTGQVAVETVNDELFRPLELVGAHTTEGGLLPDDMVHPKNAERLSRLGSAGTFVVSSNDLALAFSRLSDDDLAVLREPAVFSDQYGFGHTGTIEGAKACTWILQDGATVLSAAISGDSVSSGGGVCDRLLPALATDLGVPAARPDRWP